MDKTLYPREMIAFLQTHAADRADEICAKLDLYTDCLIETNKQFNLTAITDLEQIRILHHLDSMQAAPLLTQGARVADVGSGAGFPGIVLALMRPDCNFTLMDSLNKRVNFLQRVIDMLGLTNCTAIHTRAEDAARTMRGQFDHTTARAVAALPTLLEYCCPLTRAGGKVIAYKGDRATEELQLATRAMQQLGCKIAEDKTYVLPDCMERHLLVFDQSAACPTRYPRGGNKPRIQPL